jgi:hypothetical protein
MVGTLDEGAGELVQGLMSRGKALTSMGNASRWEHVQYLRAFESTAGETR